MELMRTSGAHGNEPARGGQKIALLRRGARTRGIANTTEIEGFLVENGWSVVDIEELDFRQQVDMFRSADAVASVLGSGLTGLMYAPRGVKVLTLAPSDWGDLFFLALMQERDASLADVRGLSTTSDPQDIATATFSVETSAIASGLAALQLLCPSPESTTDCLRILTAGASSSVRPPTDGGRCGRPPKMDRRSARDSHSGA